MKTHLANEEGSIMVITLLVMAILTVLGISAINQSNIDMLISGNERQYKQNFFRAEGAANEAVQRVDNAAGDDLMPENDAFNWLQDENDWPTGSIENPVNWNDANSTVSLMDPNTRFAVVMTGVAGGASLDITAPSQLFEFEIHGRYLRNNVGWSQVALGYRKRF